MDMTGIVMETLRYVGPIDAVMVPVAPGQWVEVERGRVEAFPVAIAEQLLAQGPANWVAAEPGEVELIDGFMPPEGDEAPLDPPTEEAPPKRGKR